MLNEAPLLRFASIIATEYSNGIHLLALSCLITVRGARHSWQLLLLIGSTLLMIGVGGYCLADQVKASVSLISAAQNIKDKLALFQQITSLAYGGIGVGLISLALTMPDKNKSKGLWSWLGLNAPVVIVLVVISSLLFG